MNEDGETRGRPIGGRVTPKKAARAAKCQEALEYRKLGLSYASIAKRMGMKHSRDAWQYVQDAVKALMIEPAEDVIRVELEKLGELEKANWAAARGGSYKAAVVILKVMQRRADMLDLDKRVNRLNVENMSQAELEAMLLALVKEAGQVPG